MRLFRFSFPFDCFRFSLLYHTILTFPTRCLAFRRGAGDGVLFQRLLEFLPIAGKVFHVHSNGQIGSYRIVFWYWIGDVRSKERYLMRRSNFPESTINPINCAKVKFSDGPLGSLEHFRSSVLLAGHNFLISTELIGIYLVLSGGIDYRGDGSVQTQKLQFIQ